MDQHKGKADHKAGYLSVLELRICDTENRDHEDEREDDFNENSRKEVAVHARKSVGAHTAGQIFHTAEREDRYQESGCDKGSDTLRNDIEREILHFHSAREQKAQGYRRVNMASGEISYTVRHRNDDKSERHRREHISAAEACVTSYAHCCSAAEKTSVKVPIASARYFFITTVPPSK